MKRDEFIQKLIQKNNKKGQIKKGINENLKGIERMEIKLILLANDVDPKNLIEVFPKLCQDRKIFFLSDFDTKKNMGKYLKLSVGTSVIGFSNVDKEWNLEDLKFEND